METKMSFPRGNGVSQDPASTPSPAGQGGPGLPQSLGAVREKRRGVKPGSKRGPYNKGDSGSVQTQGEAASPMAALFTPENTKLICRMPFNMAFAKTGWTGWQLNPVEDEALAAPLAVTLNTWGSIDPKWVSLILFSLALISITGEKSLLYRAALEEKARQDAASGGPSGKPGFKQEVTPNA